MDVKEAVKAAKNYVADIFSEEGLTNLGLEEIKRDDAEHAWRVTVGFSRPWNEIRNVRTMLSGDVATKRTYKVVLIRDDGQVVSVTKHDSSE